MTFVLDSASLPETLWQARRNARQSQGKILAPAAPETGR